MAGSHCDNASLHNGLPSSAVTDHCAGYNPVTWWLYPNITVHMEAHGAISH